MANRNIDKTHKDAIRSSISFSQEDYSKLEEIAILKKVSIAWVVREAVETYLSLSKRQNIESENE